MKRFLDSADLFNVLLVAQSLFTGKGMLNAYNAYVMLGTCNLLKSARLHASSI